MQQDPEHVEDPALQPETLPFDGATQIAALHQETQIDAVGDDETQPFDAPQNQAAEGFLASFQTMQGPPMITIKRSVPFPDQPQPSSSSSSSSAVVEDATEEQIDQARAKSKGKAKAKNRGRPRGNE